MLGSTRRMISAALFNCLVFGAVAQAEEWPSRHITIIVPAAAGGGSDAFARPLAQQLDQQLGQRVIIENRPGGGTTVGAAAAAKAAPDGYTYFFGAAHSAIAQSVYPQITYNIETDFIPVAMVARPPHVVVVSDKVPAATLSELIAYAKANPDKLTYAHAGVGTTHHLFGELFKGLNGISIVPVPYRGAGPGMMDVVAGQVSMIFDGLGSAAPQISGGKVKALAVTSAQRVAAFPDLPTVAEAGVPKFEVATWYGLFAPKGTPQPIIDRMTAEVRKALASPAIQSLWLKNGSDVPDVYGKAFADHVALEVTRWGSVVKEAGIKAE